MTSELNPQNTAGAHHTSEQFMNNREIRWDEDNIHSLPFTVNSSPELHFGWNFGSGKAVLQRLRGSGSVLEAEDVKFATAEVAISTESNMIFLPIAGRYRWRLDGATPSQVRIERMNTLQPHQNYVGPLVNVPIAAELVPRIEALEDKSHDEVHYSIDEDNNLLVLTEVDRDGNPTGVTSTVDLSKYLDNTDDFVNGNPILDEPSQTVTIPMESGATWNIDLSHFATPDEIPEDVKLASAVNTANVISFTLSDGTVLPTTIDLNPYLDNTDDYLNANPVLDGGTKTLTFPMESGVSFNVSLSSLNETLSFEADGYTLTFNDGEGGNTSFKDGRLSTDAGQAASRGTDGGIYVPASLPPQSLNVGGSGVQTFTLATDRDAVVRLDPGATDFELEIPDGQFLFQKVYIHYIQQASGAGGRNQKPVYHVNGDLDMQDRFGDTQVNPFYMRLGESLTLQWTPGKNGRNRWRPVGHYAPPIRQEQLVFMGTPLANAVIPAGYNRIPMEVLYDPLGFWNATTHGYGLGNSGNSYRIEVSLTRNDLPAGTFTIYRPNSATLKPLPTDTGQNFAFSWKGYSEAGDSWASSNNTDAVLNLLNATGGDVTLSDTLLFIQRKYWRLAIYRTYVIE